MKNPAQAEVIGCLFKPDELVCFGCMVEQPEVIHMQAPATAPDSAQYIVPSPMSALQGPTKAGKQSARSLSNTGPRRWLVIECDFSAEDAATLGAASTLDACAAVLLRLSEFRSPVLVVHSGGKSLHGWFPVVPGEPEIPEESSLWRFMAYAVRLGADRATWCRSQWVRCPGGTRRDAAGRVLMNADGGPIKQEVLYFNPAAAKRYLP